MEENHLLDSLIHPKDIRYSCTQCGDCCREPWTIPVDESTAQQLRERAKEEPLLGFLGDRAPTCLSPSGVLTYVQESNVCVFLRPDGACYLHREFGAEGKGCICREFPLIVTETPAGSYLGYSFVCSVVRSGMAEESASVSDAVALKTILETRDHHYRVVADELPITPNGKISLRWSEYLEVESALTELISGTERSLSASLAAGHAYFVLLDRFLGETLQAGASPLDRSKVISHFCQRMKNERFALLFRIAEKTKPSRLVKRFVTGIGLTLLGQTQSSSKKGKAQRARFLGMFLSNLFRRDRALSEDLRKEIDRAVRRYILHVITRKDLVASNGPFSGRPLLAAFGGLLFVYALVVCRASQISQRTHPEEAVSLAIKQVERNLVFHARLKDPSRASHLDWFLGWWDNLVQRRIYAASITRI